MERTKGYLLFNDTRQTPLNQGFSVERFQNGHSFSSQPRYDHFDTAPHNSGTILPIIIINSPF
jgi:hypothetical protein